MYNSSTEYFEDKSSFIDSIHENDQFIGKELAIVAGHYMLMYDPAKEKLVPMLYQDSTTGKVRELSQRMAGDFPIRSFRHGLSIFKKYKYSSALQPKVAILVNDHLFQSKSFQPNDHKEIKGNAGLLRKQYYRKENKLPDSFEEIIKKENMKKEEVIMDNSNHDRTKQDILTKNSLYFSERQLRNKFDKYTKPEILKDERFEQEVLDKGGYNLYFYPKEAYSMCLTDQGECGCSGEVVQFMIELRERGYQDVIFFVPSECINPVNAGVQAATYLAAKRAGTEMQIMTVSGIGGMGVSKNSGELEPIELTTHRWSVDETRPYTESGP